MEDHTTVRLSNWNQNQTAAFENEDLAILLNLDNFESFRGCVLDTSEDLVIAANHSNIEYVVIPAIDIIDNETDGGNESSDGNNTCS